jgi:tetratricopeptide (TPR) repeat protein
MEEIRHTYLHFVLEPMAMIHGVSMKRLEPILLDVRSAPMSDTFKEDISLMVNECLIRAIEIRTVIPKSNERGRDETVQHSVEEGFLLTRSFYDALANFEKESTGMKDAYGDLLHNISVESERKRARNVTFASRATPEVISAARVVTQAKMLDDAEARLASGDVEGAKKIAEQVLRNNRGGDEPSRATFILARVATRTGNMEEARVAFEQTVQGSHDPRTLAWSHIYQGRIYDIQENRQLAMDHYHAALAAGDPAADTKAAAERGLTSPYEHKKPR